MVNERKAQAWSFLLGGLSASARAMLMSESVGSDGLKVRMPPAPVIDEHVDAYSRLRGSLSTAAREDLDSQVDGEPEPESDADDDMARYCMFECMDGEWPVLREFKSVEGLVRRMVQLKDADMVVCPFFGIPLTFTQGPQRYLFLPGGVRAVSVPHYESGPSQIVPANLLEELPIQEDGYLGPRALVENSPPEIIDAIVEDSDEDEDNDDDDDDDDDDDGA